MSFPTPSHQNLVLGQNQHNFLEFNAPFYRVSFIHRTSERGGQTVAGGLGPRQESEPEGEVEDHWDPIPAETERRQNGVVSRPCSRKQHNPEDQAKPEAPQTAPQVKPPYFAF